MKLAAGCTSYGRERTDECMVPAHACECGSLQPSEQWLDLPWVQGQRVQGDAAGGPAQQGARQSPGESRG